MKNKRIPVTPLVLVWARTSRNLSVEEVAEHMGRTKADFEAWEAGEDSPTFAQLENLAKFYQRPLAIFFMTKPPKVATANENFRGMPANTLHILDSAILKQISQLKAQQLLLEEVSEAADVTLYELALNANNVQASAQSIRSYLGIDLAEVMTMNDKAKVFDYYRILIESKQIYVFQQPLKTISGYCLTHPKFPIIAINGGDENTRKIFTLFHELGHLLLNLGGFYTESIAKALQNNNDQVEIFCNKFAHEMSLDRATFKQYLADNHLRTETWTTEKVTFLSTKFKVSKDVLVIRLADERYISQTAVDALRQAWITDYQNAAPKPKPEGGPNFHVVNKSRISKRFLATVSTAYSRGEVSGLQVCQSLNIKTSQINNYL